MAYEYDPITGRNTAERLDYNRSKGGSAATPWLVAAGIVAALVVLLWIFGGGADQTPALAPGGEVAPMGTAPADGTAPATGGALAPAQPDAAPVAPVD